MVLDCAYRNNAMKCSKGSSFKSIAKLKSNSTLLPNERSVDNKKIEIHTMSSKFTVSKTNGSIDAEWKMTKSRVKKVRPLDEHILEKLDADVLEEGKSILFFTALDFCEKKIHTDPDLGTIGCLYIGNQ